MTDEAFTEDEPAPAPPASFQELLTRAQVAESNREAAESLSEITVEQAEKMHAEDPMFAPPSSKPFSKALPEDEDEDLDDTLDAPEVYAPDINLPPVLRGYVKKR